MVTKQEELIYHAFRSPSLREQEREEIERKTDRRAVLESGGMAATKKPRSA